jgi:type II secretory pathway component GspD/PulD (secretin)
MRVFFLGLLFIVGTAFAQTDNDTLITKVIELHYVKADTLLPQLDPLLKQGETITGTGSSLVVNVSADTLSRIRPVIHQLDSPPIVFEVSIHQGNDDWLQDNADTSAVYTASSKSEDPNSQSVRVLNGAQAFVSMGNDRPVVSSVSGGGFAPGVSYQQKHESQGFYVEPVLEGQEVKIKIHRTKSQANRVNNQDSDNQDAQTTTIIPLDKWVKVSSTGAENINSQPASATYQASNSFSNDLNLYVKVKVVH